MALRRFGRKRVTMNDVADAGRRFGDAIAQDEQERAIRKAVDEWAASRAEDPLLGLPRSDFSMFPMVRQARTYSRLDPTHDEDHLYIAALAEGHLLLFKDPAPDAPLIRRLPLSTLERVTAGDSNLLHHFHRFDWQVDVLFATPEERPTWIAAISLVSGPSAATDT